MGLMDIGQSNPYARINPFAAFVDQGLKGYNDENARFEARKKDAAAQEQQAQILEFARQDAERKQQQFALENQARETISRRLQGSGSSLGYQQGPTNPMQSNGIQGLMAQTSVQFDPAAQFRSPQLSAMMGNDQIARPQQQPVASMGTVTLPSYADKQAMALQYAGTDAGKQLGTMASGDAKLDSLREMMTLKMDTQQQLAAAKDDLEREKVKAVYDAKMAALENALKLKQMPSISIRMSDGNGNNKPGRVLPAAQLETIADMRKVKETLESASSILSSGGVTTGPVSGRLQSLGATIGLTSDKFNNAKQQLSTAENIMLKLRSGAAVTEPEFERFKNEYPSVNDSPSVRDRKMANAIKYANDLMDTKLQVFQDGGYKVPESAYSKGSPVPKLSSQAPIGKVGKYSYTVSK